MPPTVLDGDSTRVSHASTNARTASPCRARARPARRDTYSDSSKHVLAGTGALWIDSTLRRTPRPAPTLKARRTTCCIARARARARVCARVCARARPAF